jgi:hypothetical protein
MSTNHHTDIPTGAAADAATFNGPLGELDEALGRVLGGFGNLLINGNFDEGLWQRGTTFTAATNILNSDDTYLMDRWVLLSDGNDIVDVSRQSTSPPGGAQYFVRSDVQTINKQFGFCQIIDAKKSIPYRGQVVSFSMQAKTSAAAISNIRVGILEWSGDADNVTSDVVSVWAGGGTDPTLGGSWAYKNTPSNLPLLNGIWETFTINNVVLGNSLNNLAVFVWVDDPVIAINDIVDIGTIQLVPGKTAPAFVPFDPDIDLTRSLYFGEVIKATSAFQFIAAAQAQAGTQCEGGLSFIAKRVPPQISVSAITDLKATGATGNTLTPTVLLITRISHKTATLRVTVASGLASGNASQILAANVNLRLFIESEL